MDEIKLIASAAPYLIPFLGALILIIFTKKYLFTGMVSTEMYSIQIAREHEILNVQKNVAIQLEQIVSQLQGLTEQIKELLEHNGGQNGRKNDRR